MLDATDTLVDAERSSRMEPLEDADARALLEKADRVVIARGKSRRIQEPSETALDDLKGPTGNYRAPLLLVDGTLIVGFSLETLEELL